MGLHENLVEFTASKQIACKACHQVADIHLSQSPVWLFCPRCKLTLGEWSTSTQCIADITAFATKW